MLDVISRSSTKSYVINCTVQMDCRRLLSMNTDYIGPSFDKIWHSLLRFHNHLHVNITLENLVCNSNLSQPPQKQKDSVIPNAHPKEGQLQGVRHQPQEVQL